VCGDLLDNDEDLLVDCFDPDCATDIACQPDPTPSPTPVPTPVPTPPAENCDNGVDDDLDGDTDCADADCVNDPICIVEDCTNNIDDDGDLDVDCADADCANHLLCDPASFGNNVTATVTWTVNWNSLAQTCYGYTPGQTVDVITFSGISPGSPTCVGDPSLQCFKDWTGTWLHPTVGQHLPPDYHLDLGPLIVTPGSVAGSNELWMTGHYQFSDSTYYLFGVGGGNTASWSSTWTFVWDGDPNCGNGGTYASGTVEGVYTSF